MASFENILTGSDNLKRVDITVDDLTITGNITAPEPIGYVVDLFDSFNDAKVGESIVYFSKTGRSITMAIKSFVLTDPLSDLTSHLYTDLFVPSNFLPFVNVEGGNNQLLSGFTYSYPLATLTPVGQWGIRHIDPIDPEPRVVFYGQSSVGGFNTLTTITAFNNNITYLSSE